MTAARQPIHKRKERTIEPTFPENDQSIGSVQNLSNPTTTDPFIVEQLLKLSDPQALPKNVTASTNTFQINVIIKPISEILALFQYHVNGETQAIQIKQRWVL